MFVAQCPECGGNLYILCCTVVPKGVRVTEDGFSIGDAVRMDTEDEYVICEGCQHTGPLEYRD